MAYTFKNAKEDFFNYLGITSENIRYIPDSRDFGIELINPESGEKCVVFISAVGKNTSSPKMYFDTRDSYPKERIITRNYARENNLKFFFLGVRNEPDCKINNFFISLEANESQIQSNSGKVTTSSTERGGNQVNLPSTFTYTKKIERLKSDRGFFFSAIHKNKLWDYMTYFDNRPYEKEDFKENVIMNIDNGVSLNRIIFGAPGTGKSHKLEEESESFIKQESVKTDITQQIKDEISAVIKLSGKLNFLGAIGVKYSDTLKDKSRKELSTMFNLSGVDELYIGSRAKEIADKIPVDEDAEDKEDQIKALVQEKIKGKDILVNLMAIGIKFSDYLYTSSMPDLKKTYELKSDAQMWWLYRGAQAVQAIEQEPNKLPIKYLERVTFHPNYSYAQFVGTYKPVKSALNPEDITYEYVPGPFMKVYVNAKKNPDKKFLLLIEEINRANVAAVFGDVFQLLDRKADGNSEYPISASEDQKLYLESYGIKETEISIPSNMYIWATMNSADQGVLPMDAAFKRRWDFEYIDINKNENWNYEIPVPVDGKIKWNVLRKAINDKLKKIPGVNEDKLLGPYFISKSKLDSIQNATPEKETAFIETFKSKVLMYLYEDVCKMRPTALFDVQLEDGQTKPHYSDICKAFTENGIAIFGFKKDEIETKYKSPSSGAVSEQE